MEIIQTFYDKMATQYDKLFQDWYATTKEQALILDRIFKSNGYRILDCACGFKSNGYRILDCACGIGTQAIGLAALGYDVTASDISNAELTEAKRRADEYNVKISFENADFRELSDVFDSQFDIVIAMDNALPHMLTASDLQKAVGSICGRVAKGGMFVASIRDYDSLLESKPPYSPPYIHKTENGQRVSFQTWNWNGDSYKLVQYIVEDEKTLGVSKFECEYRAVRRAELSSMLAVAGFGKAEWKFPDETGFYQPIVIAHKS